MSVRLATKGDRDLFIRLWTEYTIQNHKNGSDVMPTSKTLTYFVGLFDSFVSGDLPGIVLIGADDNAVLMWGAATQYGLPYDSAYGFTAQGFGTYVRPSFQGKGISKELRKRAMKLLKRKGFDSVFGSAYEKNDAGYISGVKFGFEVVQATGILRL